jgi:hypothetical protein
MLKVIVTGEGEYTYIIAMMGEKPTGGYAIKVVSIDDNEEGKYAVTVELSSPEEDSIVNQAIAYPADIVRIPKSNIPVYAVDTKGSKITTERK